jgi:predicted metal-dependent peptidase
MNDAIATKIERAKIRLILREQPFFGVLLGRLKLVEVNDPTQVDTMATDGRHLYYYPPFVEELPDDQLAGVLVHEVLHNALEHHLRRKDRDHKKWNRATDYVINANVFAAGLKLPEWVLFDAKYDGMTEEEVYAALPEDDGGKGRKGNGNDPGGCGGVMDGAPQYDQAAINEMRAEMQVAVRQAVSYAKAVAAGQLPEYLKRLVDKILEPKVDWAEEFRRLVSNSLSIVEQTWSRPNRRYLHAGFYLPGSIPDAVDTVVVAVDTSGSINGPILNAFSAEAGGVLDEGHIDKMVVVYADARVHSAEEFERGDQFRMHAQGGGGTAFSDTFRWIKENHPDAAAVIYLTDLVVTDHGDEPDCPVIWATWGTKQTFEHWAAKIPFGHAIHINPQ